MTDDQSTAVPPPVQMWGGVLTAMLCALMQNERHFRSLRDGSLTAVGYVDYGAGTIKLTVEVLRVTHANRTATFKFEAIDMRHGMVLSSIDLRALTAYLQERFGSSVQEVNHREALYCIGLESFGL